LRSEAAQVTIEMVNVPSVPYFPYFLVCPLFSSTALIEGANAYKNIMNFLRKRPMNGNEPEKNDMIQRGIDYVKKGCFKLINIF
jgi:hypothetical protein